MAPDKSVIRIDQKAEPATSGPYRGRLGFATKGICWHGQTACCTHVGVSLGLLSGSCQATLGQSAWPPQKVQDIFGPMFSQQGGKRTTVQIAGVEGAWGR